MLYLAPSALLPSALFAPGNSRKFKWETFPWGFYQFPFARNIFSFHVQPKKKKMIRGLAVIKITRGSKANELCAEIPFFQGFSLDSNIAHEYKPGSTHPKPQGSTSGQTPGRLLEFGTTLPVWVSWKVPGTILDLFHLKIHGAHKQNLNAKSVQDFLKKQCYFKFISPHF